MLSKHISPERKVAIQFGDNPTAQDIRDMCETISDYWHLLEHLIYLSKSGARIELNNGDLLELNPESIDNYITNQAEAQQISADESYYGGD